MKRYIDKTLKKIRADWWRFVTAICSACFIVIYHHNSNFFNFDNSKNLEKTKPIAFRVALHKNKDDKPFICKTDSVYWQVSNSDEILGTVNVESSANFHDGSKSGLQKQISLTSDEIKDYTKNITLNGKLDFYLPLSKEHIKQLGLVGVNIDKKAHINIKFDKLYERKLPLKITTSGSISDNRSFIISPSKVSVFGTHSAWQKCENETVVNIQDIDIDGISNDFSQVVDLKLASFEGRKFLYLPNPQQSVSFKIKEIQRWYDVPVRCCLSAKELNKKYVISHNKVRVQVKGEQPLPSNFNEKNIIAWVVLPSDFDGRQVPCRVNASFISMGNGAQLDSFKPISIEPQYIVVQETSFFHIGK